MAEYKPHDLTLYCPAAIGENAVRALEDIGTKTRIQIPGTNRFRIADGLNMETRTLNEVKNVSYLSYSQQLQDNVAYAQANGLTFQLWVRGGESPTFLAGPLQNAIEQGLIVVREFVPGG